MLVSTSDNSDTNENKGRNSIGKVIFSKNENYPITSAGFETKVTETATHLQLRLFFEISKVDNYRGKYRPHSLNGFELDYPKKDELFEITNIPTEGLPLGTVDSHENNIQ